MIWLLCACLGGSFVLSAIVTHLMRRWAVRRGFVDRPGGHKQHTQPMPLGGGVAIVVGLFVPLLSVLLAAWVLRSVPSPSWLPVFAKTHLAGIGSRTPAALAIVAGAIVLHVLGLVDDRRALSAASKLLVQIVVAAVLVIGFGVRSMVHLGPVPSTLITVLWIVGITNAFNLLDNMDGLAGGVACIAGAIFAATALQTGQIFVPAVTCMLVGAVAGFLLFNFPPATIFMGDSGSLVVGYMLAVLTILTTFVDPQYGARPYGVLAPLFVLAVPIYDTASVVWLRIRSGAKIMTGDRRHFSHRLVKRGMTPRAAVLTIYLATVATGLSATQLERTDWAGAVLVAAQCLSIVLIIAILEQPSGHDAAP
jgi:UDP-GlcNAc:undecaprenyl-phosphate GlcNAc-1-phosphate transferase